MTSRDFCYWLQGYFELQPNAPRETHALKPEQVMLIKAHLNMVFEHEIDPSMGDEKHQDALDFLHGPNDGPVKFRC